ncbi:MAG: hypothetical protein PHE10_10715, partial [Kiritimatiellae bacterium]|nr:hypothetical protein [Kiritimatiellia bacterium]
PPERQQPLAALVDRILAAKTADPAADVSALEAEIDKLVYALYGLTAPDIAIIEGRSPRMPMSVDPVAEEVRQ